VTRPTLPTTRLGAAAFVLGMIFVGMPLAVGSALRWQWLRITGRLPYIDVPGPPPGSAP